MMMDDGSNDAYKLQLLMTNEIDDRKLGGVR